MSQLNFVFLVEFSTFYEPFGLKWRCLFNWTNFRTSSNEEIPPNNIYISRCKIYTSLLMNHSAHHFHFWQCIRIIISTVNSYQLDSGVCLFVVHSIGIVDKLTALTQMAKSNKPTSDRQISHWVNATYTRGIFIADSLGCEKHNDVIRCYMLHNNASIEKKGVGFCSRI